MELNLVLLFLHIDLLDLNGLMRLVLQRHVGILSVIPSEQCYVKLRTGML